MNGADARSDTRLTAENRAAARQPKVRFRDRFRRLFGELHRFLGGEFAENPAAWAFCPRESAF